MRRGRALRRRYGHTKGPTLRVDRVHIDRQGYSHGGRYYGVGAPLYSVYDDATETYYEVRAASAADARAKVIADPRKWLGRGQSYTAASGPRGAAYEGSR
jgi:hypothetical protein